MVVITSRMAVVNGSAVEHTTRRDNVFFSEPYGDSVLYAIPVSEIMLPAVYEAQSKISPESWTSYTMGNNLFSHLEHIVKRPVTPGGTGHVFYAIILDGEIVGISNHRYHQSEWSENLLCTGGLVILDEFQRRGIATAYSKISVRIARHMKAKYFYGETRAGSPMAKIRARDGWETLSTFKRSGEERVKIRLKL